MLESIFWPQPLDKDTMVAALIELILQDSNPELARPLNREQLLETYQMAEDSLLRRLNKAK